MRSGPSLDDVLKPEADLLIPVMLPEEFVGFAVNTMNAAFRVSIISLQEIGIFRHLL